MNEEALRYFHEVNIQLVHDYEKNPGDYHSTERTRFRANCELVLGMKSYEVSDAMMWFDGDGFSSYFYIF